MKQPKQFGLPLRDNYLRCSSSPDDFTRPASEFEKEWNFPNCLGTLDGKHIAIKCPKGGESAFYNYKKFFSVVLMAMCDAMYTYTMVDIGGYGRDNDAAIFSESAFGQAFENSTVPTPHPTNKEGFILPYVIVGDIFSLKPWLIKPYPGRDLADEHWVFNYRLSRCRRTTGNAFGILAARWRVYRRPIRSGLELVTNIVKATLCLHNYLRLTDNSFYTPQGFVDVENNSGQIVPGGWCKIAQDVNGALDTLPRVGSNRCQNAATAVRNDYCSYFNSPEGQVPWQLEFWTSFAINSQ